MSRQPNLIKEHLHQSIDLFIQSKSTKFHIDANSFRVWGDKVKSIVDNRIKYYVDHNPNIFHTKPSVLSDPDVTSFLKNFHKEFIIAVADKAANNFVVVCKKHYTMVLMTELGIDLDNFSCVGNTTYSYISEDKDQIIRATARSF